MFCQTCNSDKVDRQEVDLKKFACAEFGSHFHAACAAKVAATDLQYMQANNIKQRKQQYSNVFELRLLCSILLLVLFISKAPVRVTAVNTRGSGCRTVPVISSLADFQRNLPSYLNANTPLTLMFDYDGTLSAIANNPSNTFMTPSIRTMLNRLARHPKVFLAIISGRGLSDVKATVDIPGITYGGNHGMEIEFPDGSRHDYTLPSKIKKHYRTLVQELTQKVQRNGAWVEDKKLSLTFHYREAPANMKEQLRKEATRIIESHDFEARQALEAVEAKPKVNWNKGEAALLILKKKFGKKWTKSTKVIFAGDDRTDEDAMRALQGYGKTFRISTDNIQTYADFRLSSQNVVEYLLIWISSTYAN